MVVFLPSNVDIQEMLQSSRDVILAFSVTS